MRLSSKFFQIPLSDVMEENSFPLLGVRPHHVYVDGKRTDTVDGYIYAVANKETFENFEVKVDGPPLVTQDVIDKNTTRIFVSFENATICPYKMLYNVTDCTVIATKVNLVKG